MLIHRPVALGLALSLFANAALGAGVRMFKFEETPDPREVAKVLSQPAPPPGLKMRSIRMMPAGPEDKPAVAPSDATPSEPDIASAGPKVVFAAAPAATATDTPPLPASTSPSASTPKRAELPTSLALPVQFTFDSARILAKAYPQLDAVAAGIKLTAPGAKVVIEGHTDAVGSAAYNLKLSSQRADAVRTYLITRHGLDPARLRVVGMGKLAPLDPATPGAPENRRVEFRAET